MEVGGRRERRAAGERLGQRIAELGWSRVELGKQAEVGAGVVRSLLAGTGTHRPEKVAAVSTAVGWTADSLRQLRDGEATDPTLAGEEDEQADRGPSNDDVAELVEEIRHHVARAYFLLRQLQ